MRRWWKCSNIASTCGVRVRAAGRVFAVVAPSMSNSKPVSSCLYLAVRADGASIDTIEGLAAADRLDPVQQAFIDAGAFQCGFCTPGFIMMVRQLLKDNPTPSEDDVKHYLIGNLCRCSAYPEILEAVKLAATRLSAAPAR